MKKFASYFSAAVYAACGIAVMLGLTLRMVEAVNGNYVFGFDQGLDSVAARLVVTRGKTIASWKLKSGFIIEKRIMEESQ